MKISARIGEKFERVRVFWSLYTSGLNRKEVEQFLKKDTVDAFSYFKGKAGIADGIAKRPSIKQIFYVCKEIFISFVMRLTPARRLFYGIAIVGFLFGLMQLDTFYLLASFVILNLLLVLELVDKLTTRDELEIAREIQLSLQPINIPESALLSIATFYRPARLVGGDFFDIVQPRNDRIVSIVGDVSDKGISAALYAAYTQSMFQSFSETGNSPSNIFNSLNNLIGKRLREGDFITAVIAFFDLEEKSVRIARAGHNWPLYYCANTRSITELKPKGFSIGLCGDARFCSQMEEEKIFLKPGDLLLLYSDGVTEATNAKNQMFDVTGLKTVISESAHESSEKIIGQINSRLHRFVRSDELQDDATMVAIKVK
jgi:serine phosphatase RsbU (regulator of sigma subunit)